MWMILQADKADDWVIATGKTTSVRDFLSLAFYFLGVELDFVGSKENEKAIVSSCSNPNLKLKVGQEVVEIDPNYYRPNEVDCLVGDSTKARNELGWLPEYSINDIVAEMMSSDLKLMTKDQYLIDGGYSVRNYFE